MTSTRVADVTIKLSLSCNHSSCVHCFVYLPLFHLPAMNWTHCHVLCCPNHALNPLSCAIPSHTWIEPTVMCHTVPYMNWTHYHVPHCPIHELNPLLCATLSHTWTEPTVMCHTVSAMNWTHCHVSYCPIHELNPLSCVMLSHTWTEPTVMWHTVPYMNWTHCHVPCSPSHELNPLSCATLSHTWTEATVMCHAVPAILVNWNSFIYMPDCSNHVPHHIIRQKQKNVSEHKTACPMFNSIIWLHISLCNGHMLSAAKIRHHKHVVLPYNEFKDDRPTGNMIKCWSTQCDLTLHVKGVTMEKIHYQLVEVYTACVVSWNHMWIRSSAFSNATCWWPAVTWIHTHICIIDANVCHADALIR